MSFPIPTRHALAFVAAAALACGPDLPKNPPLATPVIQDGTLPNGVMSVPYEVTLSVAYAFAPVTWALASKPAELSWLTIDPAAGVLGGTPPAAVMPGVPFAVTLTDGQQRQTSKVMNLTVLKCGKENAPVDCFLSDGTNCQQNSVICSGGTYPSCSPGLPSKSVAQCGAGAAAGSCGSCSPTAADSCNGVCQCGTGAACSGASPDCCGGNCVNTQQGNPNDCGSCGAVCPAGPPLSHPTCGGGVCGWACDAPLTACGGACVDLGTDGKNCGTCGNVCPAGPPAQVCNPGPGPLPGTCIAACTQGLTNCSNSCVNTAVDPGNCGGCGIVCPGGPNASPACNGSPARCRLTCNAGYADCGAGCVSVQSDAKNCGACGHVCVSGVSGAIDTCSSGVCGWRCPPLKPYCDADGACETVLVCSGGGGGGGCFVAGTPVTLADGSTKAIETVEPGDRVLSFDPVRNAFVNSEVTELLVHPDHAALLRINGRITTTPEHRFYVEGRWVHAEELRVGDRLLRAVPEAGPDGATSFEEKVTRLELLPGGVTVYNLEVPGAHNYFAGGVLVHNLKP